MLFLFLFFVQVSEFYLRGDDYCEPNLLVSWFPVKGVRFGGKFLCVLVQLLPVMTVSALVRDWTQITGRNLSETAEKSPPWRSPERKAFNTVILTNATQTERLRFQFTASSPPVPTSAARACMSAFNSLPPLCNFCGLFSYCSPPSPSPPPPLTLPLYHTLYTCSLLFERDFVCQNAPSVRTLHLWGDVDSGWNYSRDWSLPIL